MGFFRNGFSGGSIGVFRGDCWGAIVRRFRDSFLRLIIAVIFNGDSEGVI
jgi:hypothetical protein